MNHFFAAENLVTRTVAPGDPWDFQPLETITAQIRGDKEARQDWYQNTATKHNFYTGLEGHIPNQRVGKENPPRLIHAFAADYDIKVPADRIAEAIKVMEIKPTYFETSLGGNFRLVWLLETSIPVESRDFCTFILQRAHDWLRLGLLPGLDKKAFEETSRLYANGCSWEPTGEPPIPSAVSQAFFVEAGKAFRFTAGDDDQVPLDLVEKALREKYPTFDWPGSFDKDSQGPSFWIPESVSPQSAIVKAGGLFTFSAHATKPFYSWTDLLGPGFTSKIQSDSIAKATADIHWDSKSFWRRINGTYAPLAAPELTSYFKVSCRLATKAGQSGISPMEAAFDHIYNHQRVVGAAPFIFRPSGVILYNKERKLNTYTGEAVKPAAETQLWGPKGNFPFFSTLLDCFFATEEQLAHFLAWFKHFYGCALNLDPQPGQNLFLLGGAGIGKTFVNREVIGYAVGGFADASEFIINGSPFNSEYLSVPHWSIDDDSPSSSLQAQSRVQAMFKKVAANQQFMRNAKYEKGCMVPWDGRIGCTTNLDFVSSRIIGPLDNSSLDKTNLFRCHAISKIKFPSRNELIKLRDAEMPYLLRWLVDYVPPDRVVPDPRYGYEAFHEKTLLDRNQQGSHSASFKELMIEFLMQWFQENPGEDFFEGTVTTLLRSLMATNCNELIMRSIRPEQVSRFLEQIQREGSFKTEDHPGPHNIRIWKFYRHDSTT